MELSEKNKKAILEQVKTYDEEIDRIHCEINRLLFDLEMVQGFSKRIITILETGQDPHEDCVCGEPYFCHDEDGCSGQPHSSTECDCSLAKFKSAEE